MGCVEPPVRDAVQQDRFLQWAQRIRDDLDQQGAEVVLLARAGMDLGRFGVRYTHAALAWPHHESGPWAVRQLYFDCDAGVPQLFDQGLAAFLMGADDPDGGYVMALPLKGEAAAQLLATVTDREQAKALLASEYQANASLGDPETQNCNQWVAELLATVWSGVNEPTRAAARQGMMALGWEPSTVSLPNRLWLWASAWWPHLGWRGQREADLDAGQLRVTLPEDLARWWRERWPEAARLEWCMGAEGLQRHIGWSAAWQQGCGR